jgi:hypothetical protein
MGRGLALACVIGGALLFVGTGVGLACLCFAEDRPAETTLAQSMSAGDELSRSTPAVPAAAAPAPPQPQAPAQPEEEAEPSEPDAPPQAEQPEPDSPPEVPQQPAPQAPERRKGKADPQQGPPELVIERKVGGVGRSGTLTVEEQKRVNEAIDRGVAYLRKTQLKGGSWSQGQYAVGYAALPGLTLLECGVSPKDPAVVKAARYVRFYAPSLNHKTTYQLSLAILFLDRLGEPKDRKLIQSMALRLVAGQNAAGGWDYECPYLYPSQEQLLLKALRPYQPKHLQEPIAKGKKGKLQDPIKSPDPKSGNLSEAVASPGKNQGNLPEAVGDQKKGKAPGETGVLDPLPPGKEPKGAPDARPKAKSEKAKSEKKPKEPPKVEVIPQLVPSRPAFLPPSLRSLPLARIGGKGKLKQMMPRDDNSNTQFAILALWVARRHYVPTEQTLALVEARFRASQRQGGGWGYHYEGGGQGDTMTCVGLIGLAVGHGSASEVQAPAAAAGQAMPQDQAIPRGLKALGGYLEHPNVRPGSKMNAYLLWAVERVGVLYNLKTIGNKDWYRWGVLALLPNQQADGSWFGNGYAGSAPTLDTSMALLFLKRANLTSDLSERIRLHLSITDPDAPPAASQKK